MVYTIWYIPIAAWYIPSKSGIYHGATFQMPKAGSGLRRPTTTWWYKWVEATVNSSEADGSGEVTVRFEMDYSDRFCDPSRNSRQHRVTNQGSRGILPPGRIARFDSYHPAWRQFSSCFFCAWSRIHVPIHERNVSYEYILVWRVMKSSRFKRSMSFGPLVKSSRIKSK